MFRPPTAPIPSTLIGEGVPPTVQLGWVSLPPKMVRVFIISFWKSSASR